MDTRPSTPDATEKQVPVSNRRRVGVFIIAGLIGLGLGLIGGIVAGGIGFLIGSAQYPSLELGLIALLLWPIFVFPIAGLCMGLVTATQRSAERGSVVGAVIFGGSQLVLSISSITELWMVVVPVVIIAAVIGALIGAGSAAVSRGSSADNNVTLEAGK
jgi:hypothetical protein